MQPTYVIVGNPPVTGFSTLYGSKWVATINFKRESNASSGFSTLYGSKWVATKTSHPYAGMYLVFQYPLRVEVGCNAKQLDAASITPDVSVPSTGRSGLQLCSAAGAGEQYHVSVPSTGRSGLQRERGERGEKGDKFQYPLRVEVGCNYLCSRKGDAIQEFQYPLRVEVGCNYRSPAGDLVVGKVSVPSTGRSGLQRRKRRPHVFFSLVSVPSTGRSGLQLSSSAGSITAIASFSTLYGSKWVATAFA